jgi:hypothetical protein
MKLKKFILMVVVLLILDWVLGMARVHGLAPLWAFAILNFPFGLPYIWMETHWAGTYYLVGGHIVSELWSLGLFFFMVVAQSWLYCRLLGK